MRYLIKYLAIPVLLLLFPIAQQACKGNLKPISVLVFSGSNNHEWQLTTPLLENLFSKPGIFKITITNQPDTLKYTNLENFDVVLSNWNSWPENDLRWPEQTEKALLQFIKNGGGFVTFHASTSAFYKWPDFQEISTAAWVMDTTWHGKRSETDITIINQNHPVTKGMKYFSIHDELWVNAAKNDKFEVLGTASNQDIFEKNIGEQPAILVAGYGKGRIFHTILGHDVKAVENAGFQLLLLRGTEWAATGKVSQKLPPELK